MAGVWTQRRGVSGRLRLQRQQPFAVERDDVLQQPERTVRVDRTCRLDVHRRRRPQVRRLDRGRLPTHPPGRHPHLRETLRRLAQLPATGSQRAGQRPNRITSLICFSLLT